MDSVYDRALKEIGCENKYQLRFDIYYSVFLTAFWGMCYMNIILALAIVPHTCKTPEKPINVSENAWKTTFIPRYEDVNGQTKFHSCIIYTNPLINNETEECHEYTYDKTWYEWTVPSEYDWVCNKELNVANILAYSKIGEAFGSIFFGWFGDVYGRRLTLIYSLTMIVLGRMVSFIAGNSYMFFVAGCVLSSLPSWILPQTTSVISMEISSPARRTLITTLRFTSFSTGMVIIGLLYWWLRDWKIFFIVTTVPLLPYIIFSWKIIESPRWLMTQGRLQESIKLLKKIAKVNNRKLEENTERELLSTLPAHSAQVLGPLVLFSDRRLAINTILQMIMWISVTMIYVVLLMSSAEKPDGNPFLEFAWQSVVEVPANFVAAWLADNAGRRYAGVTSYSIMATIWAIIVIRESSSVSSWIRTWWVGSLMVIIARLFVCVIYFIINLFNMELYPTCLRQSGMSLGNVVSGGAAALAPYILYLGRRMDSRLPGIILASASLAGLLCSFLLPETLHAKLPETMEDAKNFGKKDKTKTQKPLLEPLSI